MDLLNLLREIKKRASDEDKTELKRIPLTQEYRELWDQYVEARKQYKLYEEKSSTFRKLFWSKVEADTGLYGKDMTCQYEDDEIIVWADEEDLQLLKQAGKIARNAQKRIEEE